ncbi:uncharacterized protein NPIL_350211 [Nephila pilipes]|uniref:Uncharacterized protein n=1 Tax=Nephila pilipes TaxID=299642 RepID=A0A8X6P2T5_NEPPI|nr:uncharacterized protein NPIL_350211 [Nephila pilipes]
MSGIAKLKKDEIRIVAEEIGLLVNEGMKKSELRRLIEDSDVFKNDNEAVKSAVENVLENRNKKSDQDGEIEIERLKIERIKLELQLAQVKANGNNTSFDQGCKSEPEESLDSLIKSVRTLTIKPPSKSQDWGFFFTSLERAYMWRLWCATNRAPNEEAKRNGGDAK